VGMRMQGDRGNSQKYEAVRQEDYYRIFAFLNNSHESNIAAYTADELKKRAEIFRQIHEIETGLQHETPDWTERLARWEESVAANLPEWTIIQSSEDDPSGGQKMYRMKDGSYLCAGYA